MPDRFFRATAVLLLLMGSAGCTTYKVAQSSLAPIASAPPPSTMVGRGDLYLGLTTATFIDEPDQAPSTSVGLYVPRYQVDGVMTIRIADWVGIRGRYLEGISDGSLSGNPTTIPRPDGNVRGGGAGPVFKLFEDAPFSLFTGVDIAGVSIPSRLEAYCVDPVTDVPCFDAAVEVSQDRETIMLLSWHLAAVLTPMEGVRVFLGTTVQNHPTNAESFKTNTPGEAEVTMGDPNLIVTLGGEFSIGEWFSLIPTLQYPVTANPLRYGPIVTAGFRFTLPDDQM